MMPAEHVSEGRADTLIYPTLTEERKEHRDMGWYSCSG